MNINDLHYNIEIYWSEEDSAYIAFYPSFNGLLADGDTPSLAIKNLELMLELQIQDYKEKGLDLPKPKILEHWMGKKKKVKLELL